MSKRRLSKQQLTRIQQSQCADRLQLELELDCSSSQQGLIISRFGKRVELESNNGERLQCSIRPHVDSLVAGDHVLWFKNDSGQGVVVSRFPRNSVLERGKKPVAANITQLIIVTAIKPELSFALLDSYLIMAENLNLQATIVLNKVDLESGTTPKQLQDIYGALGYQIIYTTKTCHNSIPQLQAALNNQVSVFVGQSGVGKSSLINAILPDELIATAAISALSELGRHTTSNSRYYHLHSGGALIDSPGVREFALAYQPSTNIMYGFREFRQLAGQCRFRNCSHYNTPGCAITSAVDSGLHSKQRYEHLIDLLGNCSKA